MYEFTGAWITDEEFYALPPRNVFHRQLDKVELDCSQHRNRHILFRKTFTYDSAIDSGRIYISADDYYKLYINGRFVAQGPTPAYHFRYNYNVIDVTDFLQQGENVLAVHTLYQGLINRVWQSGDNRHGLLLDLHINGSLAVSSDETFKTKPHSGYRETGTVGYDTQFLESYDSGAPEAGFTQAAFDDTYWANAKLHQLSEYSLVEQKTAMLELETKHPVKTQRDGNKVFLDFGSNYVGYLNLTAKGKGGDTITVRCGQELNQDGSVRYELRANCTYEEPWILAEGVSTLDWFDYKSFRYAEILLPEGCELLDAAMTVRHYPFELQTGMKPEYAADPTLKKIWNLCVHTQKYGVQEVIQDCMEREKGFYMGDGCYTALTNMILTRDDSMVRKLIDDSFASVAVSDGLVTCLDCSFMQEIAEFPLILVDLVLWHFRLTGDEAYLKTNYPKVVKLLDVYRRDYEKDFLLRNLDKWCVVEWPANFQDGYDVDIKEGKICQEAHVSINAYYLEAIQTANKIAGLLGLFPYREEEPLRSAFYQAFYDPDAHLFKDGESTDHKSIVGNIFPFAFGLCPEDTCTDAIIQMLTQRGLGDLSLFCTFLALAGLVRCGRSALIPELMKDEGAWLRMLREDATTTFEGWGKDTKWNTSLFHLTMSYAALFLSDTDTAALFA